MVRLGGPKVRKARGCVADVHEAGDVVMYRDSSITLLLDLRRMIKAVMDVLDSMIRNAVSLSRSVELTVQWDCVLRAGLVYPISLDDLQSAQRGGIGEFFRLAGDLHSRLSDFVHRVVVHRRDEAIRVWRNWFREDPLVHPYKWHRLDLVPLHHFFSVSLV